MNPHDQEMEDRLWSANGSLSIKPVCVYDLLKLVMYYERIGL